MSTIKDLCEITGLSLGTVSNYLNGKKIRPQNAAKIEQAIQETSYIPSNLGRSLRSGKSKTIGIIASDISAPYVSAAIAVLEQNLSERGYRIFFCNSHDNVLIEKENLDFMIQQSVSAIVIFPIHYQKQYLDNVFKSNIPLVMCDSESANPSYECNCVNYDNRKLAYDATELMIQEGHHKIACILGRADHFSSATRVAGYYDALMTHNLDCSEENIYYCDFDNQKSFHATVAMLEKNDITACLIASNNMLLGFLEAMEKVGKPLKRNISYVTFSHENYYDILPVKPTYILHDFISFGQNTLEIIEDVVFNEPSSVPKKLTAASSLILGDSHKMIASL